VSLRTPAPPREQLAGLTFATVDLKLDAARVASPGRHFGLARETRREHWLNVVFSVLLVAAVVGLWIYFR